MNLRFQIDKRWPKRTWFNRFCARHIAKMLYKSGATHYQMGGYTGFKKEKYELVDADVFDLMHWILREAGYSVCINDIEERCGIEKNIKWRGGINEEPPRNTINNK